jgi:F-type H+-transporting ATPase subunit epsilon
MTAQTVAAPETMRLKVLLPTEVLVDRDVVKIVAEAENGSFCLLPRHVDFVAALAPGLLSCAAPGGREEFMAVDSGILVKCGREVLVSTRHAAVGADLGALRQTIAEQYRRLDEHERMARAALAKLEADVVRRFVEME